MASEAKTRDTIFISYATTDCAELANWLAVKLTLEGYKIWIDKRALKGGDNFIKDIEDTIKNDSFRFLALMSPGAIMRNNPKRERALASQTRDQLGIENFIIPIRAHASFEPRNLDFYTTDHQMIDFTTNWAVGLRTLLSTLSDVGAPKIYKGEGAVLKSLIDIDATAEFVEERLWSNDLPILQIPNRFYVYSFMGNCPSTREHSWAAWRLRGTSDYIAFRPPPFDKGYRFQEVEVVSWQELGSYRGILTANIIKSLVKKEIENDCIWRGMRYTMDGRKIFFPRGAVPNDRISFQGHKGNTWIQTVSDRKYLAASDGRGLGHLAPSFKVIINDEKSFALRINIGLHITFTNETPVPGSRIPGRRKVYTQTWFNHAWLSRVEAVSCWLAGNEISRDIFRYKGEALTISSRLKSFAVNRGIDETKFSKNCDDNQNFDEATNVILMRPKGKDDVDESANL